jgi:Tol biopolymer transport system component
MGFGRRSALRRGIVAALLLALLVVPTGALADSSTGAFSVTQNLYAFGQAPVFMPDGRVVFAKDFGDGSGQQVYISSATLDGSDLHCLTCTPQAPAAPNGVPAVRPQGDWILFHSWDKRNVRVGSPGFGGLGSALYVMRPNGSGVTQLTGLDAAHGSGEGEDDYHAYWSPDGKHVVWAHLNWNFVTDSGQGKWDVRIAPFVDDGVTPPHLQDTTVVRPANGHYYETQWWAPDGSGFLYTESWGTAMNLELFYCRVTFDAAGIPAPCDATNTTRLTDSPAWDEQALFTPDVKNVIFMPTRDHPGFFNTVTGLTNAAGLTTDEDYLLVLPLFEAGFLQPVAQEATDLYELNLATGSVRRLTRNGDDGWIIPEFTWDPTNRFLMWTEARFPDGLRVPLPFDAARQLRQTTGYLRGLKPPPPAVPTPGDLQPLPLERRTEIGRFG